MCRSSQRQQLNINDQLYMWGAGGRVRFQTDTTNWCNWASLASSPEVLSAGGLCVEFDISYAFDTTAANWIGFATGFQGSGEPLVRTTDAGTDFGFKIGKDGTYTRHVNGTAVGTPVSGSSALSRHVKLEYVFSSFADGAPVKVKATVAGSPISFDTFNWNGNAGGLYMELENRGGDTYFDNIKFSTAQLVELVTEEFRTGAAPGSLAASFNATTLGFDAGFENATYTLIAGPGDADNGKFTMNAFAQLITGSYDFKQGAAGTAYSIRVQATAASGATSQKVFSVIPIKDDDMDLLPDDWELSFTGNTSLANLSGLATGPGPGPGSGNYDGDAYTDMEEYNIWLSTPGYSPISLDSDGDTIVDTEELTPTEPNHVVTNPVLADSDRDGVQDDEEYVAETNPNEADTDGDGARDGFEIERGSDPIVDSSRPVLPPAFALVQVTDDASSGISTDKTYTHCVSGGAAATINGVEFNALTPTSSPANFTWTVNGGKNSAATPNLGSWVAASGGVTGAGLQSLYGTFVYGAPSSGAIHTYQLGGLTPGQTYQLKIFLRKFADNTLRPIDLIFTNGSDVKQPFGALLYDRPQIVLNNGNSHSAYYLSYTYVAQDTTMTVVAQNHPAVLANAGGPHLYGLTNEVVETAELQIVDVSRDPSGAVTIDFLGSASTQYQVTKSPDLATPFVPLTTPLSVTTDAGGIGQAVVPATEASEASEFYRIED
jgi:hypothetical protein